EAKEQRNVLGRGRHRLDVPDSPFGERVQEWILEHNVEHLYGPEEVDFEVDELVVLIQVRNGRRYVKPFIEHYFSLGAKHIVFLDNGSTDGTVEALKNYENVPVLRCGEPEGPFKVLERELLHGRGLLYAGHVPRGATLRGGLPNGGLALKGAAPLLRYLGYTPAKLPRCRGARQRAAQRGDKSPN